MNNDSATLTSGELRNGDFCHDFLMKTIDQQVLEAGDYRGQKIWLAFYRYAGCPICASHLAQVIEAKSMLAEANITFVAVYDCESSRIPTWIRKNADTYFRVVADPTQALHEQFGATKSFAKLFTPGSAIAFVKATAQGHIQGPIDGSLSMMPAHILVDESGRVVCAYYANNAGDNIPWKVVRAFADMANTSPSIAMPVSGSEQLPTESNNDLDDRTQISIVRAPAPAIREGDTFGSTKEFAVNYKWKIRIGSETDFLATWIQLEEQTRRRHPQYLGARLYLDSDQYVSAFSVWTNKASWQEFWITKEQALPDYMSLNAYIERAFEPQICRSLFDSFETNALQQKA